ncbi:MAG TPA: methyltransferase domain-containing protein, partial [Thermoanaerobaculia bacterium]
MSWWETWFGEEYLELYPHRDEDAARREAAFALERLDPEPGPLLDLCCGRGLHSIPLLERGIKAVGLDWSAPLLTIARAHRKDFAVARGDMRQLPFLAGSFRSVVNFFTSFGYFLRETENAAVVSEIERVLMRGGRFLCDTFGLQSVLAGLVPQETFGTGERQYRVTRRWNDATRRIEKEIEVRRAGSTAVFTESVRAYTAEELCGLLSGAGLSVEGLWGDFDGRPHTPDS